MTTDYTDPKNRFIEWTADNTISDALQFDTARLRQHIEDSVRSFIADELERLELAVDGAVSANVNQAVAEAISELEIYPSDQPDKIRLEFSGGGQAERFIRLVSADDICSVLDGYEDGAEEAIRLADRLEAIAKALRTHNF